MIFLINVEAKIWIIVGAKYFWESDPLVYLTFVVMKLSNLVILLVN